MNDEIFDSEQSLAESHSSIVAIQQGKHLQLEILAQQLRPYLKHVVRNEMGGQSCAIRDDESDIVQQTLTRAVEHAGSFRGSSLVEWRLWLAAIARSQVRDAKRYWNADRRSIRNEVDIAGNDGELMGDQTSPSSQMRQNDLSVQLTSSVAKLSDAHRQIVEWRHQQNLSHAEIAERLGISVDAARQRAKAAMDALRKIWHNASCEESE